VDIFDAGPTMSCPTEDIRTVRDALVRRVRFGEPEGGRTALLSRSMTADFRAVRALADVVDEHAVVTRETAEALRLNEGDAIRVKL
jgi:arginine N-succinyltransferase